MSDTRSRATIPLVPIADAGSAAPLISRSRAFGMLADRFVWLALREPPADDRTRWHTHTLGKRTIRFAQPLTLTPYAAAQPCSARCRFCSETLVDATAHGPMAASLRPPADYFDRLGRALRALQGVPLSYSLSGLENTDDPAWLLSLAATLGAAGDDGPDVGGSVLYTNGAGLVEHGGHLLPALANLGLSWLEWSRHHDRDDVNQSIMRFRAGQRVMRDAAFEAAFTAARARFPVKLVCIVQRGGIETPTDVLRYLERARTLGASAVIFREFSVLPDTYRHNATRRYIDRARIAIDALLLACIADPVFSAQYEPVALTGGYYFWNARWAHRDGVEVVFETSDYGAMREHELRDAVYKLVFHPNGNLCAGWQPMRDILWSDDDCRN
ncbi:hypothetical protein [Burkholderia sp. D-99]|uniref:hypothetical protein n=1 Tax=Burkholderia sp. D-99 TaxID=2717316 RepID=UPI00142225A5|nr:hypothetical protein [Burkholderia sp. D-99]NHV29445.1 hypothetical protein [Burkholderia sp. D-99]